VIIKEDVESPVFQTKETPPEAASKSEFPAQIVVSLPAKAEGTGNTVIRTSSVLLQELLQLLHY
jgi:hypothetical protein